jgi:hypothetical protein
MFSICYNSFSNGGVIKIGDKNWHAHQSRFPDAMNLLHERCPIFCTTIVGED